MSMPAMSMSASGPAKMKAARAWVGAVTVTSARAGGALAASDHWRPSLHRLVERNQLLNPFKFVYYAGLADLELAPAG